MNELINNITQEIADEIKDTNVKNIVIETKQELTAGDRMAIESIRRVRNPFRMLTVQDIANDLKVCEITVYKLFKNENFPAIKVGKGYMVMLLPYLIWKMNRNV